MNKALFYIIGLFLLGIVGFFATPILIETSKALVGCGITCGIILPIWMFILVVVYFYIQITVSQTDYAIMFAGGEYLIRELTLANGDTLYHPCRHGFLCIWIYMNYEYDGFEKFLTPCKTYEEAEKIIADHKGLRLFKVAKINP